MSVIIQGGKGNALRTQSKNKTVHFSAFPLSERFWGFLPVFRKVFYPFPPVPLQASFRTGCSDSRKILGQYYSKYSQRLQ